MRIDSRLTAPCEMPVIDGRTCRDVIRLAIEQRDAIAECNARMTTIRGLTRNNN